jgi:hypothetical protein
LDQLRYQATESDLSRPRCNVLSDDRLESIQGQGEEIMATATMTTRPPLPPFTRESAIQKVRLAEDSWNSRIPEK